MKVELSPLLPSHGGSTAQRSAILTQVHVSGVVYKWIVNTAYSCSMSRWRGNAMGRALDFAINRSRVQILPEAMLRTGKNLGQVVYTYVPLSPSSITWYRPKGGDALRLGR